MKEHRPLLWLEEFQEKFGTVLRVPLASGSGRFQSVARGVLETTELNLKPMRPDQPSAGMEAYNRQYWFRLFTVLQKEFPLTARLLGYWSFNHIAQGYLLESPPQHYDLGEISKRFYAFIEQSGPGFSLNLPHRAVVQASQIDAAVKQIVSSPKEEPWQISREDLERLQELRLKPSCSWRLIMQDWPLLELRLAKEELLRDGPDGNGLPQPLPSTQTWLLMMKEERIRCFPLAKPQGELYQALSEYSVGEALGLMEQRYPEEELYSSIKHWMAQSSEWGLWIGNS